jgi:hypothetical protein
MLPESEQEAHQTFRELQILMFLLWDHGESARNKLKLLNNLPSRPRETPHNNNNKRPNKEPIKLANIYALCDVDLDFTAHSFKRLSQNNSFLFLNGVPFCDFI